jgi:hypothetical protein
MKKSHVLLFAVLLFSAAAQAQFFIGLRGSNYGGITNVNYNPAIANSPYRLDINLIGVAAAFNNNYVGVSRKALLHPSYFNRSDFQSNYMRERVNGKDKQAYFGAQVQGPLSFMFSFGNKKNRNKNAVGFSYHANAVFNADHVSEIFARTAYYGLGEQADRVTGYLNTELNSSNLSLKSAVWNDFGITYSRVVYDKGANLIKVGGTLKLLQPIAGAYGYVKNFNYRWSEYTKLTIEDAEAKYSYSDGFPTSPGTSGNSVADYWRRGMNFKNGTPTAGGDVGVVYEWLPDKSKETSMDCNCEPFSDKKHYKLAAGFR